LLASDHGTGLRAYLALMAEADGPESLLVVPRITLVLIPLGPAEFALLTF